MPFFLPMCRWDTCGWGTSAAVQHTSEPLHIYGGHAEIRNTATEEVSHLPRRAQVISSPLHPEAWGHHLQEYPDPQFLRFILRGLLNGFRIGLDRSQARHSSKRNLWSACEHPEVVRKYLEWEVQLRPLFPLTLAEALAEPHLQVSLFGVIPKRG